MDLAESVQMRINRVYPGGKYNKTSKTLTLRAPSEPGGIGAPPLRDNAVLGWVHRVLADLAPTRAR